MDLREKIGRLSQNRQQFEGALGRFMYNGRESTCLLHVADALAARPRGQLPHFLFLGPNGPSKDYLIRGIAKTLYGSDDRIHEIDLSAYSDEQGGRRLLKGDWNCISGHVYDTGKLARALHRDPHAVFVFTHLDRAHSSVVDAFYPILDKGMARSRNLEELDFRQTLLVFSIDEALRNRQEPLTSQHESFEILMKKHQLPAAFLGRLRIITV